MLAAGSLFLPASDPISTDRTSGHNIGRDFTASSAQTFSLKLLIKSLPSPLPLPSPSPSQNQPGSLFFPVFPSWSVHSFLSPINLSCRMWSTRGVFPTVSPLFLISYPNFCASSGTFCIWAAFLPAHYLCPALLGLPSCISWSPPMAESSSTTVSLYLHLLQRNLLLPGSSVRLKRTQSKVEIWIFLLYEQMERISLAWPEKNASIALPWTIALAEKAFSPHSLSPPLSSCALCLCFLTLLTSHQPPSPLTPSMGCGLAVAASPAPSFLGSSGAVLWVPSAPAQHHPIPDTPFESRHPPRWQDTAKKQGKGVYSWSPPPLLCDRFSFPFSHCPSVHHRFWILTCPDLIFLFTLRGSSSALFLGLADYIFSGIFVTFLETFPALSSSGFSICLCTSHSKNSSHFFPSLLHLMLKGILD